MTTPALTPLAARLRTNDPGVRDAGWRELASNPDVNCLRQVIGSCLDDFGANQRAVRQNAPLILNQILTLCQSLSSLKEPLQEVVRECAGHPEYNARIWVLQAMSKIDVSQGLELGRQMLGDPSWEVRLEAARVLGSDGSDEDRNLLFPLFLDPSIKVCQAAKESLFALTHEPIGHFEDYHAMLDSPVPDYRLFAIQILKRSGDPAQISWLRGLISDLDSSVRDAAMDSIKALDLQIWYEIILERIQDTSWLIRRETVQKLGQIGDPSFLEWIELMMMDGEEHVRQSALETAVTLAPERMMEWVETSISDSSACVVSTTLDIIKKAMASVEMVDWLVNEVKSKKCQYPQELNELLMRLAPERMREIGWDNIQSEDVKMRCEAIKIIGMAPSPADLIALRSFTGDSESLVRLTVYEVLIEHLEDERIPLLRSMLEDTDSIVRKAGCKVLKGVGGDMAIELLLPRMHDESWDIRQASIQALGPFVDHPRVMNEIISSLDDDNDSVRAEAVLLLKESDLGDQRLPLVRSMLKHEDDNVREAACSMLNEANATEAIEHLLPRIRDKTGNVRLAAIRALLPFSDHPSVVREILYSLDDDEVWEEALSLLKEYDLGDQHLPLVRSMLKHKNDEVRGIACSMLDEASATEAIELLLPRTRDEADYVRWKAIEALRPFADHPRVMSEIISSLNDVSDNVRWEAESILEICDEEWHEVNPKHGSPPWRKLKNSVDQVNRWAAEIGRELLGRKVTVLNCRQGLGQTTKSRCWEVTIEISDSPITMAHSHGVEIMKGLALHELGHHLYDLGHPGHSVMHGIARSEGIDDYFDILCDERLERRLRARRQEWGIYFDRLVSYAFAQNSNLISLPEFASVCCQSLKATCEAIATRTLPGRLTQTADGVESVSLSDTEMLAIPGLVPPPMAFLALLRCGINPAIHPNPKVREALAVIPSNLKALDHKGLLEVARRLGSILGRNSQMKRALNQIGKRLSRKESLRRIWEQVLERMKQAGTLPQWLERNARGIRRRCDSSDAPLCGKEKNPRHLVNMAHEFDFNPLENEVKLEPNPAGHRELVARVRPQIRHLRASLERLGLDVVDEYAARRGRRLDLAMVRSRLQAGNPNILVHTREQARPNVYLGILIDRSGSMEGQKLDLAKSFAVLVAESARGLPGITGHINAFDASTFFKLGDFNHCAVAELEADDGNNDAAGLTRAAELAMASGKRNKLIVMISDGSPSDCSVEALECVVKALSSRHGIVLAQAAVEPLEHITFPHYVDLSSYPMAEAVTRFACLLLNLTAGWR